LPSLPAPPGIIGRLLKQVMDAIEKLVVKESISAYVTGIGRGIRHDQHMLAQLQQERRADGLAMTDPTFIATDR
jgi:hypothetical protein